MFFLATHEQPWLSLLGQERLLEARTGAPADPALVALAERELACFLPLLDAQLAGREYLTGSYSIADIAVGCGLENSEARGVTLDGYPHLRAWRERLRRRPAWHEGGA
jgi:glutathione S-transferase